MRFLDFSTPKSSTVLTLVTIAEASCCRLRWLVQRMHPEAMRSVECTLCVVVVSKKLNVTLRDWSLGREKNCTNVCQTDQHNRKGIVSKNIKLKYLNCRWPSRSFYMYMCQQWERSLVIGDFQIENWTTNTLAQEPEWAVISDIDRKNKL